MLMYHKRKETKLEALMKHIARVDDWEVCADEVLS